MHVLIDKEAGLLHLQGERGRGPVKAGVGITDLTTGLYIHGAILAALNSRHQTGLGQKIDASLFETQVALLINVAMSWLNLGVEGERWGAQHPNVVPYDAFKTKDLYIVCGAANDKQFLEFCTLLGKPELARDDRFSNNDARVTNRDELNPIINELFAAKTTDEWLEKFDGTSLPYGAINNMERVFKHPQTKARDMVHEVPFDAHKSGKLSLLGKWKDGLSMSKADLGAGPAVKLSETKPTIRRRPPLHGEHTQEVLEELGIQGAEQEALKQEGVI